MESNAIITRLKRLRARDVPHGTRARSRGAPLRRRGRGAAARGPTRGTRGRRARPNARRTKKAATARAPRPRAPLLPILARRGTLRGVRRLWRPTPRTRAETTETQAYFALLRPPAPRTPPNKSTTDEENTTKGRTHG